MAQTTPLSCYNDCCYCYGHYYQHKHCYTCLQDEKNAALDAAKRAKEQEDASNAIFNLSRALQGGIGTL